MHAKTSNNTENGDNEESSTDKDNNGICLPSSEDSLSSWTAADVDSVRACPVHI